MAGKQDFRLVGIYKWEDFTETSDIDLIAEASDLGWKPGEYASHFYIEETLFNFFHAEVSDGEVMAWIYTSPYYLGKVTVIND